MTSNIKLYELLEKAEKVEFNEKDVEVLKNALLENIREDNAKKSGNKKPYTIVKNMIKKSGVNCERFQGVAYEKDNMNYFTDGYRIFGSRDDFGYELISEPLKMDSFLDDVRNNETPITVDLVGLKTFAQLHKKDKKPFMIKVDNGVIAMNSNYLLDALTFCETDTFYYNRKGVYANRCIDSSKSCLKKPISITSADNNSIAIVLPVNVQ